MQFVVIHIVNYNERKGEVRAYFGNLVDLSGNLQAPLVCGELGAWRP